MVVAIFSRTAVIYEVLDQGSKLKLLEKTTVCSVGNVCYTYEKKGFIVFGNKVGEMKMIKFY